MRDPTGSNWMAWMAAVGMMFLLCGCSSSAQFAGYDFSNLQKPFIRDARMEGPPRVENCGLIAISTNSQFECNGKKYTTVELADIREGKELPAPPKSKPSVPRSGFQK
ncbi:MAG TPA: hypothetical protein VMV15_01880 [Candidatus Binataceae bacterium]|nr:hypothetical protein [Candidatus Binataceae bacterium]